MRTDNNIKRSGLPRISSSMLHRLSVLLYFSFSLACSLESNNCNAQDTVAYPYPVRQLTFEVERQQVSIAYMDVSGTKSSGKVALLLHGKNFNGYYWKDVIAMMVKEGYRVIVPDQPGWGRSSRPDIHYSFHLLSLITKTLLDSLNISRVTVIGHSMGGMLAARFAMLNPSEVDKLVLEDPIGLEDYRLFVPYTTIETQYQKERKATYESYKTYQQSYYPDWKPEYEQYVRAQAVDLTRSDVDKIAWVNAVTYNMIYEQPVCYEWSAIKAPVLLLVGSADRTVVGKDLLTPDEKNAHGNYPLLGKKTQQQMPHCKLIELPGMGHIAHVQNFDLFQNAVLPFLHSQNP